VGAGLVAGTAEAIQPAMGIINKIIIAEYFNRVIYLPFLDRIDTLEINYQQL
jgi:hypothetical protein